VWDDPFLPSLLSFFARCRVRRLGLPARGVFSSPSLRDDRESRDRGVGSKDFFGISGCEEFLLPRNDLFIPTSLGVLYFLAGWIPGHKRCLAVWFGHIPKGLPPPSPMFLFLRCCCVPYLVIRWGRFPTRVFTFWYRFPPPQS